MSADGFTDLDPDTLSVVLDRDTLRMKESKLFGAVLRYIQLDLKGNMIMHIITRERGDNGMFIYWSPKLSFLICWLNKFGEF